MINTRSFIFPYCSYEWRKFEKNVVANLVDGWQTLGEKRLSTDPRCETQIVRLLKSYLSMGRGKKKKKRKKEVENSDKTCTRSIPANFAYGYFPVIPDDEYSNEQLSRSVFPRCTRARSHTAAR